MLWRVVGDGLLQRLLQAFDSQPVDLVVSSRSGKLKPHLKLAQAHGLVSILGIENGKRVVDGGD